MAEAISTVWREPDVCRERTRKYYYWKQNVLRLSSLSTSSSSDGQNKVPHCSWTTLHQDLIVWLWFLQFFIQTPRCLLVDWVLDKVCGSVLWAGWDKVTVKAMSVCKLIHPHPAAGHSPRSTARLEAFPPRVCSPPMPSPWRKSTVSANTTQFSYNVRKLLRKNNPSHFML